MDKCSLGMKACLGLYWCKQLPLSRCHHILLHDNIHNDPNDGEGGICIPVEDDGNGNGDKSISQYQSLSAGKDALDMNGKHWI